MSPGEKVTLYGFIGNIALTGFKLFCGIAGGSDALIADAVHSASDIGATGTVLLGLRVAKRPVDSTHPYGHGRVESVVALLIGLVLIVVAGLILRGAARSTLVGVRLPPGPIALVGVLVSIFLKEWMFRYTLAAGKRLNSPSIIANAWDHRSDVYSSLGVFAGVAGARFGYPSLDPIAAAIVSIFIFKAGFDIAKDSFNDLTDRALSPKLIERMRSLAGSVRGVTGVVDVRGRRMGSKIIADVRVKVIGGLSVKEGHDVALEVEKRLMEGIDHLVEVMVHIDVDEGAERPDHLKFKERTKDILLEHRDMFLEIHELDYHFSREGKEMHFHLVVPPNTSFEAAHNLSKHLEEEIVREFPDASIVIHLEPPSERRGEGIAET